MFHITHLATVDSTNTRLKALAREGAPSGTVLWADCQTGGRGRRGREFSSASGGLYMSVLFRPAELTQPGLVTTLTALAVARALDGFGVETGIKWVNDIFAKGRKLCGILVEAGQHEGQSFAVLGIGLNLAAAAIPEALRPIAVALDELTDTPPAAEALLGAILTQLAAVQPHAPADPAPLLSEYRTRSLVIGRRVLVAPVAGDHSSYSAVALDILPNGELLVRSDLSQTPHAVSSADVSLQRTEDGEGVSAPEKSQRGEG